MQTSVRVSLLRVEIKNLLRKFLGAENENDCSGGKSEFENGNESSHMSDAKKYANFSGFTMIFLY